MREAHARARKWLEGRCMVHMHLRVRAEREEHACGGAVSRRDSTQPAGPMYATVRCWVLVRQEGRFVGTEPSALRSARLAHVPCSENAGIFWSIATRSTR
jgi:hypothetical protein